jgi:hypothetical protein
MLSLIDSESFYCKALQSYSIITINEKEKNKKTMIIIILNGALTFSVFFHRLSNKSFNGF